jgi:predicted RNase H-like nuclease
MPDAASLLAAAAVLCGQPVDLIAVDMPLAQSAITGRRASDNAVSRAYGGRKCSTHSPNAIRPGRISDDLREGFGLAGYPLRTGDAEPPSLIEVYPHPALVELAGAPQRLPYKARKVRRYWPSITPAERRVRLLAQWAAIVALLEDEIAGVSAELPPLGRGERGAAVKAYEDTLDAVICAWVGVCALQGRALPFGDDVSAIWIPVAGVDPLRCSLA